LNALDTLTVPDPSRWRVRILMAGFVLCSLAGWLRFQQAIQGWTWLRQWLTAVDPLYLLLGGAVWGIAALVAVVGLLQRSAWGAPVSRLAAVGMAVSYWLDRLVLEQAADTQVNRPFALGLTLFCLGYCFWVTAHPRRPARE